MRRDMEGLVEGKQHKTGRAIENNEDWGFWRVPRKETIEGKE